MTPRIAEPETVRLWLMLSILGAVLTIVGWIRWFHWASVVGWFR